MEGTWVSLPLGNLCNSSPVEFASGYQVGKGNPMVVHGHEVADAVQIKFANGAEYVGSWKNPEGMYEVDECVHIPGKQHAMNMATTLGQRFVYDWEGRESIPAVWTVYE